MDKQKQLWEEKLGIKGFFEIQVLSVSIHWYLHLWTIPSNELKKSQKWKGKSFKSLFTYLDKHILIPFCVSIFSWLRVILSGDKKLQTTENRMTTLYKNKFIPCFICYGHKIKKPHAGILFNLKAASQMLS